MLKKVVSIFIVVFFVAFIGISQYFVHIKPNTSHITTDQKIAAFTKPAVVRVVDGYSITWQYSNSGYYYVDSIINGYLKKINNKSEALYSGTGAIINPDGYIITNAHVVELSKTEDAKIIDAELRNLSIQLAKVFGVGFEDMYSYLKLSVKPSSFQKISKVILPGNEIVDFDVKSYGAPAGEGKDSAVIKIEKKNLPSILLGNSSKVALQESVWVFGYPGVADSSILSTESILVVSITNGKISATDKKSTQGAPILQVDAAASNGNSGGPLINSNGEIVGLLTFRSENNTGAVQGFNFAVPVDTVKEFVSQAGAKNEEGDVNKLYKEGLILYWGGYYKDALSNFEAVQRLYPAHSEIKKLISDCQAKSGGSKVLWSKYSKPVLIIDVILLIAIIALAALMVLNLSKSKKSTKNTVNPDLNLNGGSNLLPNNDYRLDSPNISKTELNSTEAPLENSEVCCLSGPLKDLIVSISTNPILFGRDARSCKVLFPANYTQISRIHCSLSYDSVSNAFILEDLGSTSGTFISSGKRLERNEKVSLYSGESFYLGSQDISFEVWIKDN